MNGKVRKADLKEYRRFEPVEYKLRHGQPLTAEDLVVLRARPDFLAGPALSQFWTPLHVAASIVDLLNVQRGDRVLEPGCGWGAFIEPLAADGASVVGIEFGMEVYQAAHALWADRPNVAIHHANVYEAYLNGDWGQAAHEAPRAAHADCVADETYDLVVGNPPYGLTLSADAADGDPLREPLTCVTNAGTAVSEAAFVEIALRVLKPGGWLALILPNSIYGNRHGEPWGKAAAKIRPLLAQYDVQYVIRLPEETYAPATTWLTDVWIVCKRPGPGPYCVAEVKDIGLDRQGKRTCEGPDDLSLVVDAYRLDRDEIVTIVSEESRPSSPVVVADWPTDFRESAEEHLAALGAADGEYLFPFATECRQQGTERAYHALTWVGGRTVKYQKLWLPVDPAPVTAAVDEPVASVAPVAPLQLALPGTPASYTQLSLW